MSEFKGYAIGKLPANLAILNIKPFSMRKSTEITIFATQPNMQIL
jgi:hypothetical protein